MRVKRIELNGCLISHAKSVLWFFTQRIGLMEPRVVDPKILVPEDEAGKAKRNIDLTTSWS